MYSQGSVMYIMLLDTEEKQANYKQWLKFNTGGTLRQYRKYLEVANSLEA